MRLLRPMMQLRLLVQEPQCRQPGCDTRSVMCRFLRARDFDLKAAVKMYNEYCTVVRPYVFAEGLLHVNLHVC